MLSNIWKQKSQSSYLLREINVFKLKCSWNDTINNTVISNNLDIANDFTVISRTTFNKWQRCRLIAITKAQNTKWKHKSDLGQMLCLCLAKICLNTLHKWIESGMERTLQSLANAVLSRACFSVWPEAVLIVLNSMWPWYPWVLFSCSRHLMLFYKSQPYVFPLLLAKCVTGFGLLDLATQSD